MTETTTQAVTQRYTPWQREGLLPAEMQDANIADVLSYADLDFSVSKRPIMFQRADGTWAEQADRMFIARDDTDEPFDVVSKDYGVYQYEDAVNFLDQIEGVRHIAAHPLRGGRQMYVVVQLPDLDNFTLVGDDMELNVLVRTSHDRTRAIEVFTMPVRIMCTNQLPIRSMSQGVTNRWAINHIGDVTAKMHTADEMITNVRSYVEDFKNTVTRLAKIPFGTSDSAYVMQRTLRDTVKRDEVIETINSLWQNANTVGHTDNAWGFVNAVSDYFEHGRTGGTAQSRLLGALEGQTRNIIDKVTTMTLGRYSHN